jgi:hypothetical protein
MTFYVSPPIREERKHEWTFRVIASDRIFSDRSMKNLHVESGSDVNKKDAVVFAVSHVISIFLIFSITHFVSLSPILQDLPKFARSGKTHSSKWSYILWVSAVYSMFKLPDIGCINVNWSCVITSLMTLTKFKRAVNLFHHAMIPG